MSVDTFQPRHHRTLTAGEIGRNHCSEEEVRGAGAQFQSQLAPGSPWQQHRSLICMASVNTQVAGHGAGTGTWLNQRPQPFRSKALHMARNELKLDYRISGG